MKLTISKQFQDFVEGIGLSMDTVLEAAQIPNILWKEELELSSEQYYSFLNQLDEVITDDQILAFSEIGNISTFMPAFYVALCAKNALQGFERFSMYKKLICPLIIDMDLGTKEIRIHMRFDVDGSNLPRFSLLNEQMVMISLIRTGTGKHIKPLKLQGPYKYGTKLVDFAGVQPESSEENLIVFKYDDAILPFITQNNVMSEYLEPELKKRLEALSNERSFLHIVEKMLISAIPSGHFSREEIAKSLGLSVRGMQRMFAEEGTTFANQVNKVQQMLAMQYVVREDLSIEEIAYLVGYKDQPSLSRAFKNWTGLTISQFRQQKA